MHPRTVEQGAVGNGGGVSITTGSLKLTNGAVVSATTFGQGDAGSVFIAAHDTVAFDGVRSNGGSSGAYSRVTHGAMGKGGDINITANSLTLTNSAALTTSSTGNGAAGGCRLEVTQASSLRYEEVYGTTLLRKCQSYLDAVPHTLPITRFLGW